MRCNRKRKSTIQSSISIAAVLGIALWASSLASPNDGTAGQPSLKLSQVTATGPAARKNEELNSSTLIFWTDGSRLKAVTLTCIVSPNGPVGIVSIPVHAWLNSAGPGTTAATLYAAGGREALTAALEELFSLPIKNYISIDQDTLTQVSEIIGPLQIGSQKTTLLEIFEGNYTCGPVDLQTEIRLLARSILGSSVLIIKIPHAIWVLSSEIESNIEIKHFFSFYQLLMKYGPSILYKQALPEQEVYFNGKKYRQVTPGAWKNTLRTVTCRKLP